MAIIRFPKHNIKKKGSKQDKDSLADIVSLDEWKRENYQSLILYGGNIKKKSGGTIWSSDLVLIDPLNNKYEVLARKSYPLQAAVPLEDKIILSGDSPSGSGLALNIIDPFNKESEVLTLEQFGVSVYSLIVFDGDIFYSLAERTKKKLEHFLIKINPRTKEKTIMAKENDKIDSLTAYGDKIIYTTVRKDFLLRDKPVIVALDPKSKKTRPIAEEDQEITALAASKDRIIYSTRHYQEFSGGYSIKALDRNDNMARDLAVYRENSDDVESLSYIESISPITEDRLLVAGYFPSSKSNVESNQVWDFDLKTSRPKIIAVEKDSIYFAVPVSRATFGKLLEKD